jgi:hypothetical protein
MAFQSPFRISARALFSNFAAVDVAVKHRKPRKEGDADQVFHPFDVLVEIDQSIDFLDLSDGSEKFVHGASPFPVG